MIVRRLPTREKTLFLTFDDGPHPTCTPAVLRCLEAHRARATFFLVAERAERQPSLTSEILSAGHAVGNHSLDHRYRHFFTTRAKTLQWISRGESLLAALTGAPTVGFRSPAGVRTPPLHWALRQLGMPLIHWSVRFFDTRFAWTAKKALGSLGAAQSGDIVLLHDCHEGTSRTVFMETLSAYLSAATSAGFRFAAIPPR